MKKILLYAGAFIILLIAGGLIFLNQFKTKALPDYDEDVKLTGLTAEVTVFRDSLAIPHVYATNEKDLYTAVGYLMAQDRLWQMDLLRRVTQGRLAEIFGKGFVDADVLFRALRFTEKSERIYAEAEPNLRESLDAFTAGVNQYIANAGKKLPPEFGILGYKPEPWQPVNSLNLIGYMAWDLSSGWTFEIVLDQLRDMVGPELANFVVADPDSVHTTATQTGFHLDKKTLAAFNNLSKTVSVVDKLGLDIFRGSNNWAVSGKKSTTGKPLLANDMHLGLNIPGIWYQMHQVIPGKLNVTGVVLPGQPMVIAGHNDKIAWGFTNVMTDDTDFYLETINPSNPGQYRLDGQWRDLKTVEEVIRIKGGDSVIRYNLFTHRGPIISGMKKVSDKTLSLRWMGNEPSNEMRTVYYLNRATDWTSFRDALKTFISVNQNVVYADQEGNIGLQSTIGIPIRQGNRTLVSPGDTSLYDWKGIVPFEELPYTFNPECGYVSSANCKTAPNDYPYYISSWFLLPYRLDRIREMLAAKEKLSVEDFRQIQTDQRSKMAEKFTRYFVSHLNLTDGLNEKEKALYEKMRNWDFSMAADRAEPLIFEKWYWLTGVNLMKDQLDSALFEGIIGDKTLFENFMENVLVHPECGWVDDLSTSSVKETLGNIIGASFRESVRVLSETCGENPDYWKWGDVHTFTITHPLASVKMLDKVFKLSRGPFAVGGSFHTVEPYSNPLDQPSKVSSGASERHIFDLSNWDHSLTVIPTGESGIPSSSHFCDQTEMYIGNRYHPDYFSAATVQAAKRYRMKFVR